MPKKPQRKKFFEIEIPLIREKVEAMAYSSEELKGKSVKMDMTRRLRGKSLDLIFKIELDKDKDKDRIIAFPKKLVLLPFFIRHMLRKSISYVEDSIKTESKESNIIIKPFLITRKKVSRAVCRTLRNSARNWIIDYAKTKKDAEIFEDVLDGNLQKPLSLKLKKIYPLALCEIRILEIKNPVKELPKKDTADEIKAEVKAKE